MPKAGGTKQELLERARKLDVRGRSRMSKSGLADAIAFSSAGGSEPTGALTTRGLRRYWSGVDHESSVRM